MTRVFIAGATSAIASATARLYANEGASFYLVARSSERNAAVAADLRARGAKDAHCETADLADTATHQRIVDGAAGALGTIDVAVIAYGILGDQEKSAEDFSSAEEVIRTNFTSVVSLLIRLANRMAVEGSGVIAVISSVAGDRGRQSNFVYGASKGGLSIFLEGLRNRLHSKGVAVITIKPGFVDTPMTGALPKNFLYASPERIAEGIRDAIARKTDVVYLPWFWRPIMAGIRLVPERVFKRMKL